MDAGTDVINHDSQRDARSMVTGTWSVLPSGTMTDLLGVWGSSPSEVWVVGTATLRRWDGSGWSMTMTSLGLSDVNGTGMGNVWAVGGTVGGSGTGETPRSAILRLQGTTWMETMPGSMGQLHGVWAIAPNDVWAVGEGTILHFDGSAWSDGSAGAKPMTLYAVWASGPRDVWAVGSRVLHWNGTGWSVMDTGTSDWFNAVWGTGPNDVWVVGVSGAALHYDGSRWTDLRAGNENLYAVWGPAANDVWAVGENGTILHWNGASWMPVPSPTRETLRALWGSPNGSEIWAVGHRGVIVRYRP